MAMSVVYTNFGGMLVHEDRGGTERQYVSDTLGSLIGELNSTQAITYTAEYWPYGEVQTETGTNTSPWNFVGLLGYLRDLATLLYVRARHYLNANAMWLTADPLWPVTRAYSYTKMSPIAYTDSSGLWQGLNQHGRGRPGQPVRKGDPGRETGRTCRKTPFWQVATEWYLGPRLALCWDCLQKTGAEDIAGSTGVYDKQYHCVAGCLARLLCPNVCVAELGWLKELLDAMNPDKHQVEMDDAVATDDGWDCGEDLADLGYPVKNLKMNAKACLACCIYQKGWR